ncbi:MAG: thioredoxin family protein [Thermoanaerobaculia bacterium]|nr:thioredoxin family protein [Thermoanaerobaculia bacterium]
MVASLLIGAGFLFLSRGAAGRAMRLACAFLLLIAGAAFALPRGESAVTWQKYDTKTLAAASAAGKPVVIDFFADWCLPCKELDAKTFGDQRVAREMDRFVRVKADLTLADDPATLALSKQYGIIGVPAVVFLDAKGEELRELRLNQFESADPFLARLKQAR